MTSGEQLLYRRMIYIDRKGVPGMSDRKLSKPDFETLARFRYQLRKFLRLAVAGNPTILIPFFVHGPSLIQ